MRLMRGDTVKHKRKAQQIGIVERHNGTQVVVRWPERNNERETVSRDDVEALAEVIAKARKEQRKLTNALSLTGGSTVAELVEYFGYSTGQLRRDSLKRVANQLRRAGLMLRADDGDSFSREARLFFDLVEEGNGTDGNFSEKENDSIEHNAALMTVSLSKTGWATVFGLDENRQIAFHRALMSREPLLCLLHLPSGGAPVLRAAWEAIVAWSYRSAQKFILSAINDSSPVVKTGDAGLLDTYLSPTTISSELPRLCDEPRSLNLISISNEQHLPVNFERLKSLWPGGVYDFTLDSAELAPARLEDLAKLLFVVGGRPDRVTRSLPPTTSPLLLVLWAKEAHEQLLGQESSGVGKMLEGGNHEKFRGSNESALAVSLKAHIASWAAAQASQAKVSFEVVEEEYLDLHGSDVVHRRTDVVVEGRGRFEVESLLGSGPIEVFLHQKVFSRIGDLPLMLVLPNDALLWVAPWLLDAAHRLGNRGQLLCPAASSSLVAIEGQPFPADVSPIDDPDVRITADLPSDHTLAEAKAQPVRLVDVRGYPTVKVRIEEQIVWPERNAKMLRGISRSPGILLFGPPGCGKSRWARAIAGELGQEVRLLAPSDLRGEYVGWGQIRVREHFAWARERERRMLVIDELDAVARSRRSDNNMHSDEKATVNELLVQMDRVSQLGRIVVGTTNFIDSLDDALLRSGRFGTFIPVPVPDLEGCVDILDYYLHRLITAYAPGGALRLTVPSAPELLPFVKPLFDESQTKARWFCGADLEAAVTTTFITALREAMPRQSPEPPIDLSLTLTAFQIANALAVGPRSVDQKAKQRFEKEMQRYCG